MVAQGRFVVHRISPEEASYKLVKVRRLQVGKGKVPFIATHDGRTIRYPDPDIRVCPALPRTCIVSLNRDCGLCSDAPTCHCDFLEGPVLAPHGVAGLSCCHTIMAHPQLALWLGRAATMGTCTRRRRCGP